MIYGVSYPEIAKTHCHFSDEVYSSMANKKGDLAEIKFSLNNPKSDAEVIADLFILNQMIDDAEDINEVKKIYPTLSKYNKTKDPNIQTLLAGVYRKIKVPDAFGPLVVMLIQNAIRQSSDNTQNENNIYPFDPNEEIGGAILDYLA